MTETKPSKGDIIEVCLHETDFATACAKLNVGRDWLTLQLAQIELIGGYHRRSNSPILMRDAR